MPSFHEDGLHLSCSLKIFRENIACESLIIAESHFVTGVRPDDFSPEEKFPVNLADSLKRAGIDQPGILRDVETPARRIPEIL
jgi:hypothetical protein